MENKKKYFIGERFKNRNGQEFEIIGYSEKPQYRRIKFVHSGYECDLRMCKTSIACAYDYKSPTVRGVGIVGFKGAWSHPLYRRWIDMICRVHNPDDINYKNYGGNGVTITEEWYYFPNYIRDISQKENYEQLVKEPRKWEIDKDLNKSKIYNNESTIIITKTENMKECLRRNASKIQKKVQQFDLDNNLLNTYESITKASEKTGISKYNIGGCCRGKVKTSCGYIWKYA